MSHLQEQLFYVESINISGFEYFSKPLKQILLLSYLSKISKLQELADHCRILKLDFKSETILFLWIHVSLFRLPVQ